ncbi:hypothetical protein AB0I22_29705 [Streptomyces sp. NPDC050610]|uniref:hypothetical protein n=1 Tax=Streptomyces sp. NPDC050610 TaxID=3157097 RepID=UPI0034183E7D
MALLLGLLSSVLWGAADFAGGRLSRARSAYSVIFVAQTAALGGTVLLLLAPVAARAEPAVDAPALAWGVARRLDHERLRPLQLAGITVTFLGVACIAAG